MAAVRHTHRLLGSYCVAAVDHVHEAAERLVPHLVLFLPRSLAACLVGAVHAPLQLPPLVAQQTDLVGLSFVDATYWAYATLVACPVRSAFVGAAYLAEPAGHQAYGGRTPFPAAVDQSRDPCAAMAVAEACATMQRSMVAVGLAVSREVVVEFAVHFQPHHSSAALVVVPCRHLAYQAPADLGTAM